MYMTFLAILMMGMMMLVPSTESVITMGILLVFLAMTSTVLVTLTSGSWFGFILFLMYITGVLVLFSYMMAMTPNNQQTSKSNLKTTLMYLLIALCLSTLWSIKALHTTSSKSMMGEEITFIYSGLSMNIYWTMAIILLVALLMAVKICYKSPKALRQYLK